MTNAPAPERRPTDIVTLPVRLAFPVLFVPRPKHPKTPDVLTYQATLLLPPTFDLAPIVGAIKAAATAKWGNVPSLAGNGMPLKACDGKKWKGFLPGWRYLKAQSNFAPDVVDQAKQRVYVVGAAANDAERERARLAAEARVFPGCWVRAIIGAYAWTNSGDKGVSFNLNAIQLVRADERLDGRISADEGFDVIDTGDEAPAAVQAQAGRSGPAAAGDPLDGLFGGGGAKPTAGTDELAKFL